MRNKDEGPREMNGDETLFMILTCTIEILITRKDQCNLLVRGKATECSVCFRKTSVKG